MQNITADKLQAILNIISQQAEVPTTVEKQEFDLSDAEFTYLEFEQKYACIEENHSLVECATDLTRVLRVLIAEDRAVLKIRNMQQVTIWQISEELLIKKLKNVRFSEKIPMPRSTKTVKHTAADAYLEYKRAFSLNNIKFYEPKADANVLSIYRGLYYKTNTEVNMKIIEPFLTHMKEVICNGDEKKYDFICEWISFMVRAPYNKCKSVLCITGGQGTGKNIFTRVLCEMMRNYAVVANKIDQILGKNNAILEFKRLVIGDEVSSFNKSNIDKWQSFKHDVTELTTMYENKYLAQYQGEMVANYILVSNNRVCVPAEVDDRRFLIMEVSDKYKQNTAHFRELCSHFWTRHPESGEELPIEEFFNHLTSYFYNKPRNSDIELEIAPMTIEKAVVQDSGKPNYIRFIEDYYNQLTSEYGIKKSSVSAFIEPYLDRGQTVHQFAIKLNRYCLKNRVVDGKIVNRNLDMMTVDGEQFRAYKLTEQAEREFAYAKIED